MSIIAVFDINGTLLHRLKSNDYNNSRVEFPIKISPDTKLENYCIWFRPHLSLLNDFLQEHKIPFIFWSTCIEKNTEKLVKILEKFFPKHYGFLSQSECKFNPKAKQRYKQKSLKDLEMVEKKWYEIFSENSSLGENLPVFDVNKVVLVDDSLNKNKEGQNIILVNPYKCDLADKEVFYIIKQLHNHTNCNDKKCYEKYANFFSKKTK
ncbi:hypothetical protein EDEG_00021 [Edhazardia aedis USNM 41457]|uniref:Mitochondrial import inner membrane translocase subunit TIM50 n=1 Tax=Edhazardia aedis (strain USNM 41457) TaxID=1003232 RepID=J8ZPS0_EDHAE|nr:hypothetical protein EDEG_00021 [Edhazardia aedis USNM 41457]|eukprot:EJW01688.1 hypothetical protein EDEG_00021 [Edhazardia aedis USNM 41457]